MTANDDTHPKGENVSDAQIQQKVLRELVESQLDSVADNLIRLSRDDVDLDELAEEIEKERQVLTLMKRLLEDRDDSLYVDLVNGPDGEMRQ